MSELTKEQQNRIDDLAASFVEGSTDLQALSNAISEAVKARLSVIKKRKG